MNGTGESVRRARLVAMRALEVYIYNVDAGTRAEALFPGAHESYLEEWAQTFTRKGGESPFYRMDISTMGRYLDNAMARYGEEAEAWVAAEEEIRHEG